MYKIVQFTVNIKFSWASNSFSIHVPYLRESNAHLFQPNFAFKIGVRIRLSTNLTSRLDTENDGERENESTCNEDSSVDNNDDSISEYEINAYNFCIEPGLLVLPVIFLNFCLYYLNFYVG